MSTDALYKHHRARTAIGPATQDFDASSEPRLVGHHQHLATDLRNGQTVSVPINAAPAVLNGFGVLVATDDGYVRLFPHGLGRRRWRRRLDSSVYATPTFDPARRRVILCGTSGLVGSIGLQGTVAWTTRLDHRIYAAPTVLPAYNVLVVACFDSTMYGLDLQSGAILWTTKLPAPWDASVGGITASREIYATPAVSCDRIVGVSGEHVACLDPDGKLRWIHNTGTAVKASPLISPEHDSAIICGTDGAVRRLRLTDGAETGRVHLHCRINASPAFVSDLVLVGTTAGRTFGISIDGAVQIEWSTTDFDGPFAYTAVAEISPKVACMTTNRGTVVGFRASNGDLLWETSQVLGLPEHEPDAHSTPTVSTTGRMYVAAYTGDLYEFQFPPATTSVD